VLSYQCIMLPASQVSTECLGCVAQLDRGESGAQDIIADDEQVRMLLDSNSSSQWIADSMHASMAEVRPHFSQNITHGAGLRRGLPSSRNPWPNITKHIFS
jgi:hypothetical protein